MRKILGILGAVFVATNSYGAFQIQLDAGQLRANSSTGLPVGSLLIFISAGANGIFDTVPTAPISGSVNSNLTPGSWVAGDDVLLSVRTDANSGQAFNNAIATNETLNLFTVTQQAGLADNQKIALMWFPQITYSQWLAGTTPTAGMTFGFYNPIYWGNGTNNPDGLDPWIVPASGLVNLNFFTNEPPNGGTQAPYEGFGSNFVIIPEPSTFALIGVGAVLIPLLRRRKA
jgi:hypothetical protein